MNLKTYEARSMAEALARVKQELGRDAVILHTRSVKRGGVFGLGARQMVEITAARGVDAPGRSAESAGRPRRTPPATGTERLARDATPREPESAPIPSMAPQAGPPAGETPAAPRGGAAAMSARALAHDSAAVPGADAKSLDALRDEIRAVRSMIDSLTRESRAARRPDLPAELVDAYTHLISAQVADEFAREIVADLDGDRSDPAAVRARLAERLAAMVPIAGPLSYNADDAPRVVALVGPTGMGKTTTVAKLAANAKIRDRRRVGLLTIDHFRIGAIDQLRTYASILGVPVAAVSAPEELPAALDKLRDCQLILIDTAGRAPRDELRIGELRTFLDAARPHEVHLVLSSTHSEAAALEAIHRFAPLGADRVIFTKLDEAVGFGVILNLLRRVELKLSYVTHGQAVPNDIAVAEPARIADLVLRPVDEPFAVSAGV